MQYEWDEHNRRHVARHGITPAEAEQVLRNAPLDMDEQVVGGEERLVQIGETDAGRILVLVSTWRMADAAWGLIIRVVTGWDAPYADKQWYMEQRKREWPS